MPARRSLFRLVAPWLFFTALGLYVYSTGIRKVGTPANVTFENVRKAIEADSH
jgi:hypothetical protein